MIAAGLEIALAVGRLEESGAALQDCDKAGDGALGQFSQRAFQFGDRHLDGVEVRAVGRQVSDRAVFPDQDFRHSRTFGEALRLSSTTMSPSSKVGKRWCSSQASKVSAFMAWS